MPVLAPLSFFIYLFFFFRTYLNRHQWRWSYYLAWTLKCSVLFLCMNVSFSLRNFELNYSHHKTKQQRSSTASDERLRGLNTGIWRNESLTKFFWVLFLSPNECFIYDVRIPLERAISCEFLCINIHELKFCERVSTSKIK